MTLGIEEQRSIRAASREAGLSRSQRREIQTGTEAVDAAHRERALAEQRRYIMETIADLRKQDLRVAAQSKR